MHLLLLALVPVVMIAIYVYLRDRYEREPIHLLLKSLAAGALIVLPVILFERVFIVVMPPLSQRWEAFYTAFVVAAFTEETFKYLALMVLIWPNKNFNEKFDRIVYAVFISLGFAAIENIKYVYAFGPETGYIRMMISVPAHALFGVTMGYYAGLARFYRKKKSWLLFRSWLYPILLHGVFDFILMAGDRRLLILFIPFVIYLYFDGLRHIKNLSKRSVFRA